MANGNGHAVDGMNQPLMAPSEFTSFRIGGVDLKVPVLTLWDLERNKEFINGLSPDMNWVDYSANVLHIVALQLEQSRPDLTYELLARACSAIEARNLVTQLNELLIASGLIDPNVQAAPEVPVPETNSGTGTQTALPLNSPSEESALATQSPSSAG